MKLGTKFGPYGTYEQAIEIPLASGGVILLTEVGVVEKDCGVEWSQEVIEKDWFLLAVDLMANRICCDEKLQYKLLSLCSPEVIEKIRLLKHTGDSINNVGIKEEKHK